jgi:hypothetical protein
MLENTVAKYEVNITRTGQGAAEAAAEFKALDSAAGTAGKTTDGAAAALLNLHHSSLLGRDSLHALNGVALLIGTEHMPVLGQSIMAVHGTLNLLRNSAKAAEISVGAMAGIFGAVGVAIAGAMYIWSSHREEMKKTAEQAKETATALEAMPAILERISKLKASNLISPTEAKTLTDSLRSPEVAPVHYASPYAKAVADAGTAGGFGTIGSQGPWSDPSKSTVTDQAGVTKKTIDAANKSFRDKGLTDANDVLKPEFQALEQLKALQDKMTADRLSGFDKERDAAKRTYEEQLDYIKVRNDVIQTSTGKSNQPYQVTEATGAAAGLYNQKLDTIAAKQQKEESAAEIKKLEAEITFEQATQGKARAGLAEKEYADRYALFARQYQAGEMMEDEYTLKMAEAIKERRAGIEAEAEEKYRIASSAAHQLEALDRQLEAQEKETGAARIAQVKAQFAERQSLINSLNALGPDAGGMGPGAAGIKTDEATAKMGGQINANETAQASEERKKTEQEIKQFENSITIDALQKKGERVASSQEEYNKRVAFYNDLYQQGKIDEDKYTDAVQAAQIKRLTAANQESNAHKILMKAEEEFSSGAASAIVSIANGSKTAEQAFRQFATTFLDSIAKMILQMIILAEVQALLKSLGLFAGASQGTVTLGNTNPSTATNLAALGGMFRNNALMAAAGLPGVGSVDTATYFPKFNVVAGEAGREMLTVLARPQYRNIGGLDAIVGNAGNNKLAITNADALAARQGGSGASGTVHIEISHSEESKAAIISQSIDGAEVRVTQRMRQNSQLRDAAKKIMR